LRYEQQENLRTEHYETTKNTHATFVLYIQDKELLYSQP
jgi:hypothetical protein